MAHVVQIDDLEIKIPPQNRSRKPLFLKHLVPYLYVKSRVEGARVLDIGCGHGYGSYILGQRAATVTGVDRDAECIDFGRREFGRDNTEFLPSDVYDLPVRLEGRKFDFICAFEFIEHLERPEEFLRITHSLLAPEGWLFMTTPNRLVRAVTGTPWNPDHVQEFDADSYRALLEKVFEKVILKSISGTERALQYNRMRTGGAIPHRFKRLWRYLPEVVRSPLRALIGSRLPADISLDDFTVDEESRPGSISLFSLCGPGGSGGE